jgi:hypothetical protein
MDNDYLRLMANPYKIKHKLKEIPKKDLLQDYISDKFVKYDHRIIEELYIDINNYVNSINIDDLEIKYLLDDLIGCVLYFENT